MAYARRRGIPADRARIVRVRCPRAYRPTFWSGCDGTVCPARASVWRVCWRSAAVERVSRRETGAQGSEQQQRAAGVSSAGVCRQTGKMLRRHAHGGRRVDGKKALHNPAHRCAAGNRRFSLPYAFGNAGDRCGDVQRVLNARFAGADTACGHYSRTFETEKRIRRWRRDRLCGHFDGRGGMTSPRARRRFVRPSLSHRRAMVSSSLSARNAIASPAPRRLDNSQRGASLARPSQRPLHTLC